MSELLPLVDTQVNTITHTSRSYDSLNADLQEVHDYARGRGVSVLEAGPIQVYH